MLEIIFADKRPVFHPLLVYDISTNSELAKHICAPLSELCCPYRINAITYRNYGIQIIEFHFFFGFPTKASVHDSFHSGNSRSSIKLSAFKDILQMLAYSRDTHAKQGSHRFVSLVTMPAQSSYSTPEEFLS